MHRPAIKPGSGWKAESKAAMHAQLAELAQSVTAAERLFRLIWRCGACPIPLEN